MISSLTRSRVITGTTFSSKKKDKPTFTFKALGVVLLTLLVFYIASLPFRTFHIDEAILAEHAYWFAEEGKVKANLYAGTGVGWEDELLVYHKLFIWSGAALISVFGLSLPVLRVFSLFFAIGLCTLIYFYCKGIDTFSQKDKRNIFMFSLILLLLSSQFFAYSFIFRPEIMQAFLGFGSFFALSSYIKRENLPLLLLAAILAGLATLTHLNGLIFCGAGAFLLLINKKYKAVIIYSFLVAVVSSLYAANMVSDPESWERFIWQFKGDPALEEEDLSIRDRIIRLFGEHKRYFHSYVEASLTLVFIVALILKGKFLWQHHRNLLIYPFACAFFLACISQGLTSKYHLLFLPQAILVISISFYHFLTTSYSKRSAVRLAALLFLFASIQLFHNMSILNGRESVASRNQQIAQHIPKGSYVYSNLAFFFNEVENHKITGLIAFELLVNRYFKIKWSKEDFFGHVKSLGCNYIAFDLLSNDWFKNKLFDPEDFKAGNLLYGYKVIHSRDGYVIMQEQ